LAEQQPTTAAVESHAESGDSRDPRVFTSVVIATPSTWRVLDLSELEDVRATESLIAKQLGDGVDGGEAFAATLAGLAAGTAQAGLFFAALSVPDERGTIDLTSVTLAIPVAPHKATAGISDSMKTQEAKTELAPFETRRGASQNAVSLPAGPAARVEVSHMLDISAQITLPVFCVEYAVALPSSTRTLVVTFTTIAPSDMDRLRAEFEGIASTLAFT
jgi:hypothetical protein